LYEEAVTSEHANIVSSGALATYSGAKTGRSPKDKRIVENPQSSGDIWWGDVNIKLDEQFFLVNRQRACDYFNVLNRLYVFDGFAGWDPKYQLKVRVICTSAYHALFMHNMLIRPTEEELENFGEPDYTIFNAGHFPANPYTPQMTSATSVSLDLERGEFVILGTEYAGEMKKGVFTLMNYLMPKRGVLSMHCSANEGENGDVSLFFGLSGTGKTTLSADVDRRLIGDDEQCWTDDGVFNIEGGCYAKAINLSAEREPEIHGAIRFGSVLENVVFDPETREVDFTDASLTENTRCAYPIHYIPNAKIPCVGGHPQNIILLTCDAFGVLPPVSRLSPEQAMYHFISGYTAKVAGTEVGVTEPRATFSACFGAAFMVWHPTKYAELLAERIRKHGSNAWLVNTGWSGGAYGVGKRMDLKHTRAIVDAIHDGSLLKSETQTDPTFGLEVPTHCPGVPDEILIPKNTWAKPDDYDAKARELAGLFHENFAKYRDKASAEIRDAGPRAETNAAR
jgi:phosphoenolpyruvate carboxykinase (ATP)